MLVKGKTYVIAEIGINHMGDIDMGKKLIDSAVNSGVDAVKFQTYITEKRAPKGNQEIFDILKKCELPFSAFDELKNHTNQYDVDFFSTPFDEESVDCLNDIGVNIYKIASFDTVNHKLLRYVRKYADTIIMSSGMSTLDEVKKAYDILSDDVDDIILLHCVSSYPTEVKDANLNVINTLQTNFPNCMIGQSDHTPDIKISTLAVACGARVIEKHFKIDEDCVDAPVSILPYQMSDLINGIRDLETMLGDGKMGMTSNQESTKIFRRFSE
jgi:sialic acid synthase SpsE